MDFVHVVGGGARNQMLCQMTADARGLPVLAVPMEATALGNLLVQARTLGADIRNLAGMRSLVRTTHELVPYEPAGDENRWIAAQSHLTDHRKMVQ